MKNIKLIKLFVSAFFVMSIFSCDDDEKIIDIKETVVNFKEASTAILETGNQITVNLKFSQPALSAGSITIKVLDTETIQYNTNFSTNPIANVKEIELQIGKSDISASFDLSPIEQQSIINSGTIKFEIIEVSEGFSIGLGNEFVLILREHPQIITSVPSLNFPDTYAGSYTTETYILNTIGLTNNLDIETSDDFYISLNNIDFSTELSIVKEDVTSTPLTIYVRFSPPLGQYDTFTRSIIHSSEGVEDLILSLEGNSIENTAVIQSSTLDISFPATVENQATETVEYQVNATDLTEDIIVTSSANFEISLDEINFSNQLSLDFTTLNTGQSTSIYTRFSPTTVSETNTTGIITHSSLGANTLQINLDGIVNYDWQQVAYTSFEEPVGLNVDYQDTGDASVDHELTNNDGQNPVSYTSVGNELGFRTFYESTGGTGATDGDDLGVTTKTSIVGTHFEGTQSYVVDDTDGIIKIKFDSIDISNLSQLRMTYNFLLNQSSYEQSDYFKVYLIDDQGQTTVISYYNGSDIESNVFDDENWHTIDTNLPSLIGKTTVQLVIEVSTTSNAEELYFDYINFEGVN